MIEHEHEPVSTHRFRLELTTAVGSIGEYAECKHCRCIFAIGRPCETACDRGEDIDDGFYPTPDEIGS